MMANIGINYVHNTDNPALSNNIKNRKISSLVIQFMDFYWIKLLETDWRYCQANVDYRLETIQPTS